MKIPVPEGVIGFNPDEHLTHKLPIAGRPLFHLATELVLNCLPRLELETSKALCPCGHRWLQVVFAFWSPQYVWSDHVKTAQMWIDFEHFQVGFPKMWITILWKQNWLLTNWLIQESKHKKTIRSLRYLHLQQPHCWKPCRQKLEAADYLLVT